MFLDRRPGAVKLKGVMVKLSLIIDNHPLALFHHEVYLKEQG
jgi:hypothetical protein